MRYLIPFLLLVGCKESDHNDVRCRPDILTWKFVNESNAKWGCHIWLVTWNDTVGVTDTADMGQNGTETQVTHSPERTIPEHAEFLMELWIETNDGWRYDIYLTDAAIKPCTPPWTVRLRLTCHGLWIEWPEDPEVEPILLDDPENPDICDDIP